MRWIYLLAGLMFFAPATNAATATTDPNSVQFLYSACKSNADADSNYCLGFIEGVGQMMAVNSENLSVASNEKVANGWIKKTSICLEGKPLGAWPSGGAMEQAFINWAQQHPEHWADGALSWVVVAMGSTWPCPSSN